VGTIIHGAGLVSSSARVCVRIAVDSVGEGRLSSSRSSRRASGRGGCCCSHKSRRRLDAVNSIQLRADPLLAKAALGVAVSDLADDVSPAVVACVWPALFVAPRRALLRALAPPAPLAVV
jgi:hypothetical protein